MVQYTRARLDASFAALSDATRRGVLEQLGRSDASITDLAERFHMTLTGMKKHVGVLEQAGLVATEKLGRVRTCKIGPRRLEEETAWIEDVESKGYWGEVKLSIKRWFSVVASLVALGWSVMVFSVQQTPISTTSPNQLQLRVQRRRDHVARYPQAQYAGQPDVYLGYISFDGSSNVTLTGQQNVNGTVGPIPADHRIPSCRVPVRAFRVPTGSRRPSTSPTRVRFRL